MKSFLLIILVVFLVQCKSLKEEPIILTDDGGWCWFSDPRALYSSQDEGIILTGWVKSDGTVEGARISINSEEKLTFSLFPCLQADDHNNPAFAETADGGFLAVYTRHSDPLGLLMNFSRPGSKGKIFGKADTLAPFNDKLNDIFPVNSYTYGNPMVLKNEAGRIYCFGRWAGYKPNMMYSDDNGETWSDPVVVICPLPFDPGNRPYVKYYSDGKSRIHLLFTDGHPRNEEYNSVYYACYESGGFYRDDGSLICKTEDLPFTPEEASVVYRADKEHGRAWVWDIRVDENQVPSVVYTRHPEEDDHRYHFASFNGFEWVDSEICRAGKWFPETPEGQNEREPHYSGGICLHPGKSGVVFLSRPHDGVFEIERWESPDSGKSWKSTFITKESRYNNVRPFVPGNLPATSPEIVLWMQNKKYIHYQDYQSSIWMKKTGF